MSVEEGTEGTNALVVSYRGRSGTPADERAAAGR